MALSTRKPDGGAPLLLLVALRPEEADALARELAPPVAGLAASAAGVTLRAVADPDEARRAARLRRVWAIVCGLDVYPALAEALPHLTGAGGRTPTLVLAPPGSEPKAAALLEREGPEVLLQAGNYRPLLVAWVRRALAAPMVRFPRREPSWEEVGRIVRHEINNPLTGVLGNAELLLADPSLPPQLHDRLRTIAELAVRMRDVVHSLEVRLQQSHPPPPAPSPPAGPFELLARQLIR